MELDLMQIVGAAAMCFGIGIFAGLLLGAWPDRRLKQQLDDARISLGRREAFIESMARTNQQERKALLERLDVNPADEGKCQVFPRDRKSVAELLTQRRRAQAREEKTFKEVYEPMMETQVDPGAVPAPEPIGEPR